MKRGRVPLTAKWKPEMQPQVVERPKGRGAMLSPKTPFGPERQAERLQAEGHEVQLHRGKWRLSHFPASSSR